MCSWPAHRGMSGCAGALLFKYRLNANPKGNPISLYQPVGVPPRNNRSPSGKGWSTFELQKKFTRSQHPKLFGPVPFARMTMSLLLVA